MGIETKQTVRFIILTALIVVGSSCSAFTKGKGNAEAAVAQFHDQYNAGHFREIYSQTDEEFKKSTTEADFVALLEALRRKLGTVKQASPAGWKVNSTPMGTMVSLGYNVEFTEGKGMEQFLYRLREDKALLINYNVNSPLLITK